MRAVHDRIETTDGSRPQATPLGDRQARDCPLSAFAILAGGDVFERVAQREDPRARAVAQSYVSDNIILSDQAPREAAAAIRADIVRQLSGNTTLVRRLRQAKPVRVDIVAQGRSMVELGFPRAVRPRVAGVFWDSPGWAEARIGLRAEHLEGEPALVVHEMAHAIHYLAFTATERELIYRLLRPTFGTPAAMDEVFAIYSEREFLDSFEEGQKRAPGVYGFTRRQWDENHVFTRFVRKLYFPHMPLAGPKLGGGTTFGADPRGGGMGPLGLPR